MLHSRTFGARFRASQLVLLATLASPALANTHFVALTAAPGGNGTSWASAFTDLQSALSAAQPGDQIWIARGRYWPSNASNAADPRTKSFLLPHDVAVYGGFAGFETTLAQRVGGSESTVLDGDIGVAGVDADNCYHIVRVVGSDHSVSVWLDGVSIENGNALGSGATSQGGGVHVDLAGANHGALLRLRGCRVAHCRADFGAGISCRNLAHLQLVDCVIEDNHAVVDGGGLQATTALVTSFGTTWRRNVAQGGGGAVNLLSTSLDWVRFESNVFHDNSATIGGALHLAAMPFVVSRGRFDACTIAFNSATQSGGGIYVDTTLPLKSQIDLTNSILWGNQAPQAAQLAGSGSSMGVNFCILQGGWSGKGARNLAVDPQFANEAARDFRLTPGSWAIDSGHTLRVMADWLDLDNDGVLGEPAPFDAGGQPRIVDDVHARDRGVPYFGAIIDRGAFEH